MAIEVVVLRTLIIRLEINNVGCMHSKLCVKGIKTNSIQSPLNHSFGGISILSVVGINIIVVRTACNACECGVRNVGNI